MARRLLIARWVNFYGGRGAWGSTAAAAWAALLLALATGCGESERAPGQTFIGTGTTPVMPMPTVGQAALSGRVRGADGRPITGAIVAVAETDLSVPVDATGVYRLAVPADSTVTLVALASGFAPTFHESVMVASGSVVEQVDFLALPVQSVDAINALVAPGQESTRGLLALRLRSAGARCPIAGARIKVWPPLAGQIAYSRPGDGLAADQPERPDLTLTAVQPGTVVSAWLVGAMPPGNGITFTVEQEGCILMAESPSLAGMVFQGRRHVMAQALTEGELFLGEVLR